MTNGFSRPEGKKKQSVAANKSPSLFPENRYW
jgi:hypothetical protein